MTRKGAWTGVVAEVVEGLLSKFKALSSSLCSARRGAWKKAGESNILKSFLISQ
jgi:hypothetical protein